MGLINNFVIISNGRYYVSGIYLLAENGQTTPDIEVTSRISKL